MKLIRLFFLGLLIASRPNVSAQQIQMLTGIVVDSITKDPVPFATVFLKQHTVGVLSDEQGRFKLPLRSTIAGDTIAVSAMGYHMKSIALSDRMTDVTLALRPNVTELSEVVVTFLQPTDYIKRAMRQLRSLQPEMRYFMTGTYYEKIVENGKALRHDEAIFKSYHPLRKDSMRMQSQILLYKKGSDIQEMKFMLEERKKQEEKESIKAKKENKTDEPHTGLDFIFMSGGPQRMLWVGGLNSRIDDYLDSTRFKDFTYSFASTANQNSEMVVIEFKSKGVVNHVEKSGKIYIHLPTNAIMKIEGDGNYVIPVFLRPLLFLYGFSAQDLLFTGKKEYQLINGRLFLKSVGFVATGNVAKRRWFAADEKARFEGEQVVTVVSISDQNAKPIEAAKKFYPYKLMERQVHPDAGVSWEDFPRVK